MQTPMVAVEKFQQLLSYLEAVGIDAGDVAHRAGLDARQLRESQADVPMPAVHYSRLYHQAVSAMQRLDPHVPWAAGLGTDAFEMLCRAIIGSSTLREALGRAQRFSGVLTSVSGNRISVEERGDAIALHYHWCEPDISARFAPINWYRTPKARAVTLASGLVVWHGLISWLVGHAVQVSEARIAADPVHDSYSRGLGLAIAVRPQFEAPETCLLMPNSVLDYRIVQNHDSLQGFLEDSVLQLIRIEQRPATVCESVKRLLGTDFSSGLPTFSDIAERLHTSESSLRRRLLEEETSFQTLKDEVRCDLAKEYLLDETMRLSDVAERLGFTEQSSFGRSFRQWTGMSPSAWRSTYCKETTRKQA